MIIEPTRMNSTIWRTIPLTRPFVTSFPAGCRKKPHLNSKPNPSDPVCVRDPVRVRSEGSNPSVKSFGSRKSQLRQCGEGVAVTYVRDNS